MPSDAEPQTSPNPTFEQALARLERIVVQLEDGRSDLTESLVRYEEGIRLLRRCHGLLARAERKIELLAGIDAEGRATTEPFDDVPTAAEDSSQPKRTGRRSTKQGAAAPESAAAERPDVDEPGTLF